MAGVPLLNGFLSKEMFFAEAVEAGKGSAARPGDHLGGAARQQLQRRLLAALHPPGLLRPAADDLPREPHEPPRWMRVPVEFLVLACLVVGIVPALTIGPYLHMAAVSVLGPATPDLQPGALARLQRAADHERGGARRRHGALRAAGRLAAPERPEGPPLLRLLKGQRIFERMPRHASGGAGRARSTGCSAPSGCSRSCRILVLLAARRRWRWRSGRRPAAAARRWTRGSRSGRSRCSGWSAPPAPSARPGRRSTTASPR